MVAQTRLADRARQSSVGLGNWVVHRADLLRCVTCGTYSRRRSVTETGSAIGTGVTMARPSWLESLGRWREVLADDPEVAERVSDSSFPPAPGAVLDGDDDRSAAFDHGGTDRGGVVDCQGQQNR